jgi:peroxiredoxin
MTKTLLPDAQVRELSVDVLSGDHWSLSTSKPKNFTMIVFYRGLHCPVCKSYLEKLNALIGPYEEAGFDVIAVSMDSQERAQQSMNDWDIGNITIGYGLTVATARDWGLYISKAFKEGEADMFVEPGLFWVRPDGRLYLTDISNMPWCRPDLEFLYSKIPFAVEKGYPARGTHTS